jgi:hypothetical protein
LNNLYEIRSFPAQLTDHIALLFANVVVKVAQGRRLSGKS